LTCPDRSETFSQRDSRNRRHHSDKRSSLRDEPSPPLRGARPHIPREFENRRERNLRGCVELRVSGRITHTLLLFQWMGFTRSRNELARSTF
ncbi:hypothetical protein PENTCL1PPCAC_15783, partial [Pristionchus entomophagus]